MQGEEVTAEMISTIDTTLARQAVNTIKFLAIDAIEKANSGHPGMPMGAADVAFVLWTRFLRYDPSAPMWHDRDRFVLSAGHGSMLLYALLHLSGYDLTLDDLKRFRQWDSKTPGHPEFGRTVGVETTTGPLGQGVANAVGMALAGQMLADRFNGPDFNPVNHRVFCLAGDGDMMEGVSGEAASMAGHLGLGNLVVLYDDNRITIEGSTDLAWSEDVGTRHEAYGWHILAVDGHDHEEIAKAISAGLAETARPTLIRCRTHIAHGSPGKQDSASSHGAPLGSDETAATRNNHGWPEEPKFNVPEDVRALFRERAVAGGAVRAEWDERMAEWREKNIDKAASWDALWLRQVPDRFTERLLQTAPTDESATRVHGGHVLQDAAAMMPALVGGSADLVPSTKTVVKDSTSIAPGEFSGRNMHFGVREHAMGAVMNGMLYHGAFRSFGSTFLVFADYMRPSMRVAALAGLPAIYIFTHDSIFVGEDGPTHQPIEQAASLRLIPNLWVFRPADGLETALAWGQAVERTDGPSAILLTRQKVPPLQRSGSGEAADMKRGGYLVAGGDSPDAILAATGSEVHIALAARQSLAAEGREINVISIPCLELLLQQPEEYRSLLFPAGVPVATIEAGRTDPWRVLLAPSAMAIGIEDFGASAPGKVVAEKLGMVAAAVTARVRDWLK